MRKFCLLFATLFVLFVSHNLFAQVTSTGRVPSAAIKPATSDSTFYVTVTGSDSNDGLSWGSAKLTPAAAMTALDADGGTVMMGCGVITTTTVTITKPVHIIGCGSGRYDANGSGTTTFAPTGGTIGIDINANSVIIENVLVSSQSTTLGTDDAIYIHGTSGAPKLINVTTNNAGRYGIYIDGTAGDTTAWMFRNVVAQYSRSDGFRFGANVGAGACYICLANNSVGGWGFRALSTSSSAMFYTPYAQSNALGGILDEGGSNKWFHTLIDAGTGSSFQFGSTAAAGFVEFPRHANPDTITNSAPSQHNVIYYVGADAISGITEHTMLPLKGATTATTYTTTVGGLGNGYWAMYDQTNSKWLLAYNPAASMWYAQQDFVMGNIPNGSTAKLRFANAAGGNTSLATGVTTGSFDLVTPAASGTLAATLSATATLNFANQAAVGCEALTITVTGAAVGDAVAIGVPNASNTTNSTFYGWVSATDTVSIKHCAVVSGDPASGTFRATVMKF